LIWLTESQRAKAFFLRFSLEVFFSPQGRPGGEAAAAGELDLPGGWKADIRELSGGCPPDLFGSF
jgi:hypothetical protein